MPAFQASHMINSLVSLCMTYAKVQLTEFGKKNGCSQKWKCWSEPYKWARDYSQHDLQLGASRTSELVTTARKVCNSEPLQLCASYDDYITDGQKKVHRSPGDNNKPPKRNSLKAMRLLYQNLTGGSQANTDRYYSYEVFVVLKIHSGLQLGVTTNGRGGVS